MGESREKLLPILKLISVVRQIREIVIQNHRKGHEDCWNDWVKLEVVASGNGGKEFN